MKKIVNTGLIWTILTIIVIILDRYTKLWMMSHLQLGEPLYILPVLNFTLAYNTGASFGFLHTASGWQNLFFMTLALVMSIIILIWLAKTPANERWTGIALSFILGGALGNGLDRVIYSHVIDFIHFHIGEWNFAIFNLADSAISVGAFILIVHWLFVKKV